MDVDKYQEHAAKTIGKHDSDFFIRKLATEVIEVAQELSWMEGGGEDTFVKDELGDCIRNIAQIATKKGIKMSDILDVNIKKMDERVKNERI